MHPKQSKWIATVMVACLTVVIATSCKSPKKSEAESGSGAQGQQQGDLPPVVTDRGIGTDPTGSDSGNIAGLSTIYFEFDKASLSADSRKKLSANADWIRSNPKFTVQIEGHTDSRGSVEYNLSLGERRAKSVKSYLEKLGVDGKRMTIISYGEEKPLAAGDNEEAWGKNRRANFVPIQ